MCTGPLSFESLTKTENCFQDGSHMVLPPGPSQRMLECPQDNSSLLSKQEAQKSKVQCLFWWGLRNTHYHFCNILLMMQDSLQSRKGPHKGVKTRRWRLCKPYWRLLHVAINPLQTTRPHIKHTYPTILATFWSRQGCLLLCFCVMW